MNKKSKKKSELKRLLGAFAACVFLCACIMTVLIGSEKARANSEYALNGTKPEYVTLPDVFL